MRLIDADRLKEVFRRNTGHDYSELIDIQPTVDVLNKIRAEITENIETYRMSDWETNNVLADGLQMALNIIDGYREGEQE